MTDEERPSYINVTPEAGARFFSRGIEGPVIMLNLLRFREVADYSASPELAPEQAISGREAYERYAAHTRPFIAASGGELIFIGDPGEYLIGPPEEQWDLAFLAKHQSMKAFLSFASNDRYKAGMGHRTAALADSRLLPLIVRDGI